MAAQVEDVKQSLERRIDHQDNLLSAVEQELEDSEAQMQYAVRGQQINQEDLQRLQAHRIQVAFDHFNAELHTVESEFTTEKYHYCIILHCYKYSY